MGVTAAVRGAPVGLIEMHPANAVPVGRLRCNGAAVSRTAYAQLFAAIGTLYGVGDGATTFNLPELRAEFPRFADDGRGVDTGRGVGSAQGDAIRNITGTFARGGNIGETADGFADKVTLGAFHAPATYNFSNATNGISVANARPLGFDASRVVPTAAENRPRSVALLACIVYQ